MIWQLGRHLLLCGDCTEREQLGIGRAGITLFDPPWDDAPADARNWLPESSNLLAFTDAQRFADPIGQFGVAQTHRQTATNCPYCEAP